MATVTKTATSDVSTAVALVRSRKREHSAAVAAQRKLKAKLASGDSSVSTDDLLRAAADIERSALLICAAEEGERNARADESRAVAKASPVIAELVAALVAENLPKLGLRAVPVSVVQSLPTEIGTFPRVFVIQPEAATRNKWSGTEDGSCVVWVAHDDGDRIDLTNLKRSLSQIAADDDRLAGLTASSNQASRRIGTAQVDGLSVTVKGYKPFLPAIESPFMSHNVSSFRQALRADVLRAFNRFGPTAYKVAQVRVTKPEIVKTEQANGVLSATVETTIGGKLPPSWLVSGAETGETTKRAIESWADGFVGGLGRIDGVRITDTGPDGFTVRFTFRSAVS